MRSRPEGTAEVSLGWQRPARHRPRGSSPSGLLADCLTTTLGSCGLEQGTTTFEGKEPEGSARRTRGNRVAGRPEMLVFAYAPLQRVDGGRGARHDSARPGGSGPRMDRDHAATQLYGPLLCRKVVHMASKRWLCRNARMLSAAPRGCLSKRATSGWPLTLSWLPDV